MSIRYLYLLLLVGLLTGCMESKTEKKLDGELLLEQKCSKCHNLDMPPKSYEDEIAPSMMAVTFHLKDFIKSNDPSAHEAKIAEFIKDYVINPSRSKSFCDKASLDSYGVMPSQKGKVTVDELGAIAKYMYDTYDNQKMLKIMQEKERLARMPLYKRVLEQRRCENCHDINKDKVAPSFLSISKKYSNNKALIESIKNGSKGKWKNFKLIMPSFKKMTDGDIEGMVNWILELKNQDDKSKG